MSRDAEPPRTPNQAKQDRNNKGEPGEECCCRDADLRCYCVLGKEREGYTEEDSGKGYLLFTEIQGGVKRFETKVCHAGENALRHEKADGPDLAPVFG